MVVRGVSLTLAAVAAAVAVSAAHAAPRASLPLRLDLVDTSRVLKLPGGRRVPRPLATSLWYPSSGSGPWPLVVFAHGFRSLPGTYARLLRAWADAGYVVAAPIFPGESADAPGGPEREDLVNEPRDVSFVISRLLAPDSPLHGVIDPLRIAVAGQSDGAMTAFATAYDRPWRDPRVRAAIVLSGAQLGGRVEGGPPLLAVTGTADEINAPANTIALFDAVARPKFLLLLRGAPHLAPFTRPGLWLATVEKVSTAFLAHYLGDGPLDAVAKAASGGGSLTAEP
ncbi:MAG: hypothetical protein JO073_07920 [Actinobacteria bacterium]|nr:hypothetical protein [Actinomycetota bacterium]